MQKRLRSKPIPHVIIPDTSILWCEDKKPTVSPDFESFWDNHHKLVPLELVIPQIVRGELLFQQVTSAQKHFEKMATALSDLSAIAECRHEFSITANEIKEQVCRKFDRWLERKGGLVRALPQQIALASIAEASVWRQPPFSFDPKNPDNEKGFRDSLILETVCDYVSQETRDVGIVFVCADKLLLDTTKSRTSANAKCSCYESLPELASYLKLTHERHEKEFTTSILDRARKKFFVPDDKNTIWEHERLLDKIKRAHEQQLKLSETEASGWEPANAGIWFIENAQFVRKDDDETFHWESPVTFVQVCNYKKQEWQMSLEAAKDKPNLSLLEAFSGFLSKISERVRQVVQVKFVVFWSVKVARDGRLLNTKIERIAFQDRSFGPIDDQIRKRFKLTDT
jgi:hypothetical protein